MYIRTGKCTETCMDMCRDVCKDVYHHSVLSDQVAITGRPRYACVQADMCTTTPVCGKLYTVIHKHVSHKVPEEICRRQLRDVNARNRYSFPACVWLLGLCMDLRMDMWIDVHPEMGLFEPPPEIFNGARHMPKECCRSMRKVCTFNPQPMGLNRLGCQCWAWTIATIAVKCHAPYHANYHAPRTQVPCDKPQNIAYHVTYQAHHTTTSCDATRHIMRHAMLCCLGFVGSLRIARPTQASEGRGST